MPGDNNSQVNKTEKIVLGGGCFWCVEAVFKQFIGIISVVPGYAGGKKANPTYEEVSRGTSGHAEVIEVVYDPSVISCKTILTIFFASHDPTTLNRQGNDVGEHYRSVIFYTTPEQRLIADGFIYDVNNSGVVGDPIVTTVEPLVAFYKAEAYHHDYYARNRNQGYCQVVISPKLDKIKREFAELIMHDK